MRACGVGVAGQNMEQHWQSPQNTYTTPFFFILSQLCFPPSKARAIFHFPPLSLSRSFWPRGFECPNLFRLCAVSQICLEGERALLVCLESIFFSIFREILASKKFIRYVHYIQVQTRHGNALANCETTSSVFEPKMIFGSMRNIGSKKGAKIPGSLKISIGFPIHCTRGTFCC